MRQNPIEMAEVIDRLFNRLSATYGADWTRQWANVPISDIKTAWGHELAGYIGHLSAIAYALENLPERCPNVIQFRNICRAAPSHEPPRIEPPRAKAELIAAELLRMGGMREKPPQVDGRDWARRIIARHEQGDRIRPYSLKCAESELGIVKQVAA